MSHIDRIGGMGSNNWMSLWTWPWLQGRKRMKRPPRQNHHSHNSATPLLAYARERIPSLFVVFLVLFVSYDRFVREPLALQEAQAQLADPWHEDHPVIRGPGQKKKPAKQQQQQQQQQQRQQQRQRQPRTAKTAKQAALVKNDNSGNEIVNFSDYQIRPQDKSIPDTGHERDGFMILGMHRSGTSMLTGLLYMAAGYKFGGHLYAGGENPKGFFERFDVVGQNSKWMSEQGIMWSNRVEHYDWEKAVADTKHGAVEFKGGARALRMHFNNPKNAPWLQKDPRMCITLKTWRNLDVLDKEPAIVFTYRHPLEVARSIHKRGPQIPIWKALHLWIVYNQRAIENSRGMCIVRTTNTNIIADPMQELGRISDELTTKCGLPKPAKEEISQEEIDKFFDPNLQHHKSLFQEDSVLESHNDGNCLVYGYKQGTKRETPDPELERQYYLAAMKIFCDLESGAAYEEDYGWPDLVQLQGGAMSRQKKAKTTKQRRLQGGATSSQKKAKATKQRRGR